MAIIDISRSLTGQCVMNLVGPDSCPMSEQPVWDPPHCWSQAKREPGRPRGRSWVRVCARHQLKAGPIACLADDSLGNAAASARAVDGFLRATVINGRGGTEDQGRVAPPRRARGTTSGLAHLSTAGEHGLFLKGEKDEAEWIEDARDGSSCEISVSEQRSRGRIFTSGAFDVSPTVRIASSRFQSEGGVGKTTTAINLGTALAAIARSAIVAMTRRAMLHGSGFHVKTRR